MPEELQGQQQTGTESQTDQTTPIPGDPGYSDFYSGLLKDLPDDHKAIVEPYIKRFDAGVQRRFQDLHNQYKPYKDSGWDGDTFAQAQELYRMAQEEPETLLNNLQAYFASQGSSSTEGETGGGGTESTTGTPEIPGGIPPEIQTRLDEQQKIIQAVAQVLLSENEAKAAASDEADLQKDLDLLKQEFGDFNEKYVLSQYATRDVTLEDAVKEWQSMIQEEINRASSSTNGLPRRTLSNAGGGAVPQAYQQNLGEIDRKDIKNLVADVMRRASSAGE